MNEDGSADLEDEFRQCRFVSARCAERCASKAVDGTLDGLAGNHCHWTSEQDTYTRNSGTGSRVVCALAG
jgi:hypothetical protein